MQKITVKNKIIKLISALLIILVLAPTLLFSKPKQAQAQWVVHDPIHTAINVVTGGSTAINTGHVVLNALLEIARQAIMIIERRLLQEMTKGVNGWINNGFHGSPLFLTNPSSFFNDIGKTEIKNLVTEFGYDPNRFPYGADFAQNIINSYKTTLDNNTAYSLSRVINDPVLLNNYRTNFNYGGWNGFLINTQYPQNNYLGFRMIASQVEANKLSGVFQNKAQQVQNVLQQGQGFLSPQTCPTNPAYDNGKNEFQKPDFVSKLDYAKYQPEAIKEKDAAGNVVRDENGNPIYTNQAYMDQQRAKYDSDLAAEKASWSTTNTCPGGLVNTTPGSVVANQITSSLGSNFRQSELGAALGNSISSILDALLSHFLDKGLTALGKAINPPAPKNTGPGSCSTGGSNSVPLASLKTQDDCTSLGGVWTLSGSSGTTVNSSTGPGICTDFQGDKAEGITSATDCTSVGGNWSSTSPQPLGTCTANGTNFPATESICNSDGGSWSSAIMSEGTAGTCGNIHGPIQASSQTDCTSQGGTWTANSSSGNGSTDQFGGSNGTLGTIGGQLPLGTCVDSIKGIATNVVSFSCSGGNWTQNSATPNLGTCVFLNAPTLNVPLSNCDLNTSTWTANSGATNTSTPPTVLESFKGTCTVSAGTSTPGVTKSACADVAGTWKADSVTTTTTTYPGGVQTQTSVTVTATGQTQTCYESKGTAYCVPPTLQ